MFSPSNFWLVVAAACLIWFSTITVYVAIRGAFDIKHMLARLRDTRNDPPDVE